MSHLSDIALFTFILHINKDSTDFFYTIKSTFKILNYEKGGKIVGTKCRYFMNKPCTLIINDIFHLLNFELKVGHVLLFIYRMSQK